MTDYIHFALAGQTLRAWCDGSYHANMVSVLANWLRVVPECRKCPGCLNAMRGFAESSEFKKEQK
jgi:hypothetical protein